MPGKLKVRVLSGRSLPVMDRASDLTDAFVEVRFGTIVHKTEVALKSLSPQWNSEWFVFEVEDEELQDEHLQLRVLDHDTYTAHDAIGKVYIDLDPLLTKDDGPNLISGWFPIYDTMHGIRGELNVIVKVELFSDVNKFRQSSCGVQFFNSMGTPYGFKVLYLHGFVEELVVNDDPEYQWIDHIRTPRSSNEARQTLFMKLSGELRRRIGLKVLEMGGNAVIGYMQYFDLEGESGIVVRGIGTSAFLNKIGAPVASPLAMSAGVSPVPEEAGPTKTTPPVMVHQDSPRRLSDSDIGSPPNASSMDGSTGSGTHSKPNAAHYTKSPKSIDMMEFPFFTMKTLPSGFITSLGGVVATRSVKLLDKIHNPEEPETRDAWWLELRTEIRCHMKTLGCHAVVGYTEQTSIWEEVMILSATGTAVLVNLTFDLDSATSPRPPNNVVVPIVVDRQHLADKERRLTVDVNLANQANTYTSSISPTMNCAMCHIPYKATSPPFPVNITRCAMCRKKRVSDVLFTTIEPPPDLENVGQGCIIQARICRNKRDVKGEAHAKEISDSLPFMEYELHNQLLTKLKMKGMNCLFGLTIQITVGDILLTAVATATAVFLASLPPPDVPTTATVVFLESLPPPAVPNVTNHTATAVFLASLPPPAVPKVTNHLATEEENTQLADLQKTVINTVQKNKERFRLNSLTEHTTQSSPRSATDDSDDDDLIEMDFGAGSKDTFILEVDDARDDTIFSILQDCCPNPSFHLSNTQIVPGLVPSQNLQMFTQVWRGTFSPSSAKISSELSRLCDKIIRRLLFRLRRLTPCCLCGLQFDLVIPDKDEIQLSITGVCVSLQDSTNPESDKKGILKIGHKNVDSQPEDMIFPIEEDHQSNDRQENSSALVERQDELAASNTSQCAACLTSGVELSPLTYIPAARVDRYLGYYNFFFIRETTSLREEGGLGGFMQSFIYEILAVTRANVSSMNGNALLSYHMSECVLMHNPHKNQAQCLINVCGDTVRVIYDSDFTYPVSLSPIPEQSNNSAVEPQIITEAIE